MTGSLPNRSRMPFRRVLQMWATNGASETERELRNQIDFLQGGLARIWGDLRLAEQMSEDELRKTVSECRRVARVTHDYSSTRGRR